MLHLTESRVTENQDSDSCLRTTLDVAVARNEGKTAELPAELPAGKRGSYFGSSGKRSGFTKVKDSLEKENVNWKSGHPLRNRFR